MDDYYQKYARPLEKLNIYEVKQNLNKLRDFLREELESLIFIKNSLNTDTFNKIDTKTKTKFFDIIQKLENVSLKEIECITEFSFEIEKKGISEIDDKIYTKIEYIRDNYNKILLNIQKMISSSNFLLEIRKNFESNKNSLAGFNFPNSIPYRNNSGFETKIAEKENNVNNSKKSNEEGKEWIEKLEKDLDNLKKEQNLITTKIDKKKSADSSFREKEMNKQNEYTVTKELDNLILKNYQSHNNKQSKEDSFRSKKVSQKFPKTQTKSQIRMATPPNKNLSNHTNVQNNTTITTSRLQTPSINTYKPPINYEIVKNLIEEMEHLKEICKDLKKTQEENCIMQNEKSVFEKIKNEHIKLNADMTIVKEDIKEILGNYHNLLKRVSLLEEENKNLRAHNQNLVKYVQEIKSGNHSSNLCGKKTIEKGLDIINDICKDDNNYYEKINDNNNEAYKNYKSTYYHSNPNRINTTPQKAKTNINQIYSDHFNKIKVLPGYNQENYRNNEKYGNNQNNTMISELSAFNNNNANQSSLELNMNIHNNLEKTAMKRRFLIPKN